MDVSKLRIQVFTFLIALAACDSNPSGKTTQVSIAEIEAGIKSYIETKTKAGDGYFQIEREQEEDLHLKLVRVHTEYLSNLGPQRHFACVDLADVSGDVYDVDFFLKGEPGEMDVTETTVHKLNGKPFYTWKQRADKTWYRVPVEDASNELLGVIEGKDAFTFRYEARLPEITETAEMWLPLATSDEYQKVKITSFDIPGKQQRLKDNIFGNTILYLKLRPSHSGQTVEIVYEVTRKEKGPYPADAPDARYLAANERLPVGGRFDTIVQEALYGKEEDSKLMQARALYDYIIDQLRYAKAGIYGTGNANHACDARSGNCTEFHSYFISLARTAGIPARFAIGAAIPSARDEGGVNGYHCWAEFYAEGKWWPVDISEGNKYTALATYYFGHHPANRIELSRGRDLEVDPAPQSGAIPFLAYPLLEVGGQKQGVETVFTFRREKEALQ